MTEWIVIGVLYVFGMGVFHLLGGLGAAAEAFRSWGAWSSSRRTGRATSSA